MKFKNAVNDTVHEMLDLVTSHVQYMYQQPQRKSCMQIKTNMGTQKSVKRKEK